MQMYLYVSCVRLASMSIKTSGNKYIRRTLYEYVLFCFNEMQSKYDI